MAAAIALPLVIPLLSTPAFVGSDNRPAMPVAESNVDETGAIRVRQQGTLEAEIGNLPTTEDGALRVQVEGSDSALEILTLNLTSGIYFLTLK